MSSIIKDKVKAKEIDSIGKIDGESLDIVKENVKKLKDLFPEVFSEEKIDFDRLQDVLGNYIDDKDEKYRFEWHGKTKAIKISQTPSRGTLRPCREESKNFDDTENLYIEGDNLEVLKLLQKSYQGKIKMIYIDPPYNTGNDFIYPDNYSDNLQNYLEITGQVDGDGNKISSNSEDGGRYHTNWLNMMYPRLRLAKNLLMENGVIFISISDDELMNLRKICDEIYGENNFLACLVWDKNHSAQAGIFKIYHEYILVYSKNIDNIQTPKSLNNDLFEAGALKKESGRHALQKFRFPKGTRFDAPNGTRMSGEWGGIEKVKLIEGDMISENGYLKNDVTLEAAFTQIGQMQQYFYGDREHLVDSRGQKIVEFYLTNSGKVKVIKERAVESPQTTLKYGSQGPISVKLAELFQTDNSPFDSPKPVEMIRDFIIRFLDFDSNDIVLDFFAGSSTTGDAVMQYNLLKNGNAKYILVQFPENLDERLKYATKDAVNTLKSALDFVIQNNMPHFVTEIGKERIRRAGDKIVEENNGKEGIEDLDIGFKVFKLDKSNIKPWNPDYDNLERTLEDTIDNFVPGRSEEDVVYEIMLKYGIDLTYPIDIKEIGAKKIFSVGFGALLICLDNDITLDEVNDIVKLKNELNPKTCRVVFKDNGFKTDSVKANTIETLRRSNITEIMSI